MKKVLQSEGIPGDPEVSLVFCDDPFIHQLNRQYLGEDRPTDVLSFPQEDIKYLGDIVISLETARRQAESRSISLQSEIELLFVHGLLHLLGYDHATPEEETVMLAKQRLILQSEE